MIRLCVFDLDGTLSDTLESIALYGNEALRECGYPAEIPTDRFRYLVGEGVDVLIARMLREAGVPEEQSPEDTARLREAFLRRYTQEPLRMARAYDGVAEMLRVLRDRGIRLAILSNKPHDLVRPVVSHLFADIPFACCYGQREGVPRKPDPQGLLQILEELGIPKEDCLYVGDNYYDDGMGASQLGMAFCILNPPGRLGIEELDLPWCVPDIRGVADVVRALNGGTLNQQENTAH